MPPRWNDYRAAITRNGFQLVRSNKHETWIQYDAQGRVARQTRASHGNDEIADRGLFRSLLKQCGKTEEHFNESIKRKRPAKTEAGAETADDQPAPGAGDA